MPSLLSGFITIVGGVHISKPWEVDASLFNNFKGLNVILVLEFQHFYFFSMYVSFCIIDGTFPMGNYGNSTPIYLLFMMKLIEFHDTTTVMYIVVTFILHVFKPLPYSYYFHYLDV
jgi:hypothetical protein